MRLHVATVVAAEPRGFPLDELLVYELRYVALVSNGPPVGPVPIDHEAFAYGDVAPPDDRTPPLDRPSFVIAASNRSPLVVGSCRKIHGEGHDALAGLDSRIRASVWDPKRRPQALLLCGDQIYADDVADPVALVVQALATALIGNDEVVLHAGGAAPSQAWPIDRQRLLAETGCFASEVSENHLLTLGEFAATYLLSWNPALWPPDLGAAVRRMDRIYHSKARADYLRDLESIQQFCAALPAVRRALANVPTYMILDDHEITDDLFLDETWTDQAAKSVLARISHHGREFRPHVLG